MVYQYCLSCLDLPGNIAECGVYSGGIAHLLSLLLQRHASKASLHLFDTFEGMPSASITERDHFVSGDLAAPLDRVVQRLDGFPFVEFHPGRLPETLSQVAGVTDYAFVHVNVDMYQSTLDCCQWFWPRMGTGGILFIGDYGMYAYRRTARAAADEYFADRDATVLLLPTGQALVIKR